jgi:hypothetical protein
MDRISPPALERNWRQEGAVRLFDKSKDFGPQARSGRGKAVTDQIRCFLEWPELVVAAAAEL